MKTKQTRQKQKYTLQEYKNGYRCSGTVVMINGLKERIQASASTEGAAVDKWEKKIIERNEIILYGKKKKEGNISLYNACKDMIDDWESGVPRELVKEDLVLSDESIKRLKIVLEKQIKTTSIAQILVKDIKPIDCDRWRNEVNRLKNPRNQLLSSSTKQRAYALIDDVLDHYRGEDNPMKRATKRGWHQKANTKTKNNVLQPDEIIQVEDYCYQKVTTPKTSMDSIYADLTLILIYCYMRPGEAYALQCRDWSQEYHQLKIQRTGKHEDGRTKTEESVRKFYVPRQAEDILKRRCEGLKSTDKIFPALRGGIISDSAYRSWLLKMLKELGITKESFSPHKLRGTGISFAVYMGMELDIVSQNAGHSSVVTTLNWYKATYDEAKYAAVKAYENALDDRRRSSRRIAGAVHTDE